MSQSLAVLLTPPLQIAAFCISAASSGAMFIRWRRMDEDSRQRVWRLYGWFTGLVCFGSCFGVVAWVSGLQFLIFNFKLQNPALTNAQYWSLNAPMNGWLCLFAVMYAMEFGCLIIAKLMVLDRMTGLTEFAVVDSGLSGRWFRAVVRAVVAANLVGLLGNVVAAVYWKQAGDSASAAAAAYLANNTAVASSFANTANQQIQSASTAQAIQVFLEVVVLFVIIAAFVVSGVACARILGKVLRNMPEASWLSVTSNRLRLQILVTIAVIFVTFLLRAVYSTMFALASAFQNQGAACANNTVNQCDNTCFNTFALMQTWLLLTPEFELMVVFISSPLALLVSLWGMTSDRILQLMSTSNSGSSSSMLVLSGS